MRMASMVQMYPPHEHREQYNHEGYYGSNSAALISSQFAFNVAPAPATLLPCNDDHRVNDNSMWEVNKSSPKMEGPFTPVPLSSSACCSTQQDDHFSYLEAITRSINSDILSFNNMASCDMGFPFADENQLVEVMGLQRSKLSMYCSSYGVDDDHDLSQESNMAAADDEKESILQAACSDGDKVKMGNLARSFTFPPSGASSSCAAARSPLILSSDAEIIKNPNTNKHFKHQLVYRENSSATTTSCSNGDEGELKGKDVTLKIEGSEILDCMLGNRDQQGCIEQNIGTTLSSRGYKQCKKRSANMGNSNTSVKAARLDTPPDVVHVRARRGQATDSHSLAERVRREKISQRMKVLQEIVPGCHKVLGKAMMLDEIINYVKSLQKQVEFLSMKLAAANQAGMASMIANEVKFWLPNMEFFGDFNSSCQVIKSEPLMHSLIQ